MEGCICDCTCKEKVTTLSANAWIEECKSCTRLWYCDTMDRGMQP